MMLTNKKTNCTSWLKLLAMLPIVGTALALNAETVNDYVYENTPAQPQKKIVKKGRKDTKINMGTKTIDVKAAKTTDVDSVEVVMVEAPNKDKKAVVMATDSAKTTIPVVMLDPPEADEKAFDVVEQMPQYPGGIGEMMKFLSMNIKYPEAAEKAGTQGRVIASFIVEKDGTITNIKVVKKVSEELDAEAVRVINAMPKWTPGMQNGQPVRVRYTIPITFRLS
jgi:TonB family protein